MVVTTTMVMMIMLTPYHLCIHTFPMKHEDEDNDSEIRFLFIWWKKRIDAICWRDEVA